MDILHRTDESILPVVVSFSVVCQFTYTEVKRVCQVDHSVLGVVSLLQGFFKGV